MYLKKITINYDYGQIFHNKHCKLRKLEMLILISWWLRMLYIISNEGNKETLRQQRNHKWFCFVWLIQSEHYTFIIISFIVFYFK